MLHTLPSHITLHDVQTPTRITNAASNTRLPSQNCSSVNHVWGRAVNHCIYMQLFEQRTFL